MEIIDVTLDTPKAVIVAGFLGSILSLKFVDGMDLKQRIFAVLMGMVMANYISPLVSHIFSGDKFGEPIGFLVGLFGMSITAALFKGIQNSNVWGFIMGRWGGGNPQPPEGV